MTVIVPLFLNARNQKGRYVILKVDSGPGRSTLDFLVRRLKIFGFFCIREFTTPHM
jgi:hypothetical protein